MSDKYGPNSAQVEAFLALLPTLTDEQWEVVRRHGQPWAPERSFDSYRAWYSAYAATYHIPRRFGLAAARSAAWIAARDAARAGAGLAAEAAAALVIRGLISREHFDALTAPMRAAGIDFDKLEVAR